MKIKTYLIILLLLTFTTASYAVETESSNSPNETVIINNENNPRPEETVFFSDHISKYDASLGGADLTELIYPSNQQFYIRKDNFYSNIPELKPFFEAMEKFSQSNVTVAYKSFNALVVNDSLNDFQYMYMAYKLSDIGLYSLADISMSNVKDTKIWQQYIDSLKELCFPKYKLNYEDEIFLANIYASINYNNLTRESISDLMKKDKIIRKSDYADSLLANALFKEKDYTKALWAINKAISNNSENINFLKLKAKILCEQEKYDDAIKVINILESKTIVLTDSTKDIEKIKYYILSKSEKNELKAKYYFAYYIYLNDDYTRAINELLPIVAKNKLPQASDLLAKIYFINKDYDKSLEQYEKQINLNKRNSKAYEGIGNINIVKKDYGTSIKYYTKAHKYNKEDVDILIDLSAANLIMNNAEESKKYCHKAENIKKDYFKSYYLESKINKDKSEYFLKKTLEYNPFYCNAWLDLADIEILNKRLDSALTYINSVKFLEENNYRYYYYKGLIAKINKDEVNAEKNFKTALILYNNKNEQIKNINMSDEIGALQGF